jgi:hypothetical protein
MSGLNLNGVRVWVDREDPLGPRYFAARDTELDWLASTVDDPPIGANLTLVDPTEILDFLIDLTDIPKFPAWVFTYLDEKPRIYQPTSGNDDEPEEIFLRVKVSEIIEHFKVTPCEVTFPPVLFRDEKAPRNQRGFRIFGAKIPSAYPGSQYDGGQIRITESSGAGCGAEAWMFCHAVKGGAECKEELTIRLTVPAAKQVITALTAFVDEAEADLLSEPAEASPED